MELSWLESLVYGMISGFSEVLPISSLAHQALFLKLCGAQFDPLLRLCAHAGILSALTISFLPMLLRMRRERRIASAPKSHRRRQPDAATIMEIRLLRTAVLASLAVFLIYPFVHDLYERLWLLAIFMAVNGVVVYVPQFLPGANKRAQSLSGLDAVVIGLCGGLGIIPGFSRTAFATSSALIRGTQRQYAAELAMVLAGASSVIFMIIDLVALPGISATITGLVVLNGITVLASSFLSAWFAVQVLRFIAYRVGFSGFAYYCWGFALLALILYLI